MATTNTFDFEQFNALMKNANTGLRLYLAEQLLQDAQSVMVRFRSPLVRDITDIVDELHQLRDDNKKYLASRDTRGPADREMTKESYSDDTGRLSDVAGPQATTLAVERPLGKKQ